MNSIRLLPAALLLLLIPACSKAPAEPQTTEITVEGMTCEACVNAITGALTELPGVSTTRVSLEDGTATVVHDPAAVTPEQLAARVEQMGYTARPAGTESPTSDDPES